MWELTHKTAIYMERQKVVTHVQTVDTRLRYECLLVHTALFKAQQK